MCVSVPCLISITRWIAACFRNRYSHPAFLPTHNSLTHGPDLPWKADRKVCIVKSVHWQSIRNITKSSHDWRDHSMACTCIKIINNTHTIFFTFTWWYTDVSRPSYFSWMVWLARLANEYTNTYDSVIVLTNGCAIIILLIFDINNDHVWADLFKITQLYFHNKREPLVNQPDLVSCIWGYTLTTQCSDNIIIGSHKQLL